MKKIGLFYGGSPNGSTAKVAGMIKDAFGENLVEIYNVANASVEELEKYDNLIFGTSAWGIGDMHRDWEMFIDKFSEIKFKGRKVALFGLGNQKLWPESFVDGMGTIFCRLPDKSIAVGYWPVEGYSYFFSTAEKDSNFVGLAIDEDTQPDQTPDRIQRWVQMLKKEFI